MTQAQDEGTCLAIESARPALAVAAIEYQFSKNPELRQRYDEQAAKKCKQDTEFHLAYLAQAIGSSSPGLFAAYVQWAAAMLSARNVARSELAENLDAIRAVIFQDLPAESAQQAAEYVDYAAGRMNNAAPQPSFVEGDDRLAVMAREYLARLLRGDRRGAGALLSDAAGRGTPLADIYLRVIQPALYEVGRLWQANEISVAQEHFCSAATQLIMAQFYPLIFKSERRGKTLVAACASGELHEIGLRAVADFFEMAGWDTHYLGASWRCRPRSPSTLAR
jgi:MerR family transcriptional regulator, light-induced transcriptional regulator